MSIYSLWIYTGSVLECSGWSARVVEYGKGTVNITFIRKGKSIVTEVADFRRVQKLKKNG